MLKRLAIATGSAHATGGSPMLCIGIALGAIELELLIMSSVAIARPNDMDWLPITFFLLTSLMIALMSESVFRAQEDRLAVAHELARLNADLDNLVAKRIRQFDAETAVRHLAEARLHQSVKLNTIGYLTSGIAHDFNNMPVIITGSLDIAKHRLDAQRYTRLVTHFDNAATTAERAATLTHRLLAYARKQPLAPPAAGRRRAGRRCQCSARADAGRAEPHPHAAR